MNQKPMNQIIKWASATLLAGLVLGSVGTTNSVNASQKGHRTVASKVVHVNKRQVRRKLGTQRKPRAKRTVKPRAKRPVTKKATVKPKLRLNRNSKKRAKAHRQLNVNRRARTVRNNRKASRKSVKRSTNRRFYTSSSYRQIWLHAKRVNVRALKFDQGRVNQLRREFNHASRTNRKAIITSIKSWKKTMNGINGHLRIDNHQLSLNR